MPNPRTESLEAELRSMVRRFGVERVDRSLRKIARSSRRSRDAGREDSTAGARRPGDARKKRSRLTTPEYVARMDVAPERKALLVAAAEKFQDKSFLPTVGDVRNFCGVYGIDGSFDSRAGAAPKVFRFLASMSVEEMARMLDRGVFSGPARLGPIADAMRDAGRERSRPASSKVEAPAE